MLIDRITSMAEHLGVPTQIECRPHISNAGQILERLEALFLVDHDSRFYPPLLGARLREVEQRYNRKAIT